MLFGSLSLSVFYWFYWFCLFVFHFATLLIDNYRFIYVDYALHARSSSIEPREKNRKLLHSRETCRFAFTCKRSELTWMQLTVRLKSFHRQPLRISTGLDAAAASNKFNEINRWKSLNFLIVFDGCLAVVFPHCHSSPSLFILICSFS